MGNKCGAHTVPYIKNKNSSSTIEHEATTSKLMRISYFIVIKEGLIKKKRLVLS